MKAAVLYTTGGPEVFKLEEINIPKPGPTQLLIKVAACGCCGHDQAIRRGSENAEKPIVLGHEVSGIVEEIGTQVRSFKPGNRVATKQFSACGRCVNCRAGRDIFCTNPPLDHINYGGYAEYVVVEDECAAMVPDNVDLVGASALICAAGIPWRVIKSIAKVQKGEDVLITGSKGAYGIHSIQLVKAIGARAIAVTSTANEEQARRLREAGADEVIRFKEEKDYPSLILEMTNGKGVDVVVENVGAPTFEGCFHALARGGRYIFTEGGAPQILEVSATAISRKEAIITGAGSTTTGMADFLECLDLAAEGKLKPVVQQYPLMEVTKAHEDMDNLRLFGRATLVI